MSETLGTPILDGALTAPDVANTPAIETQAEGAPEGQSQPDAAPQPEKTPAWLQRKIDKLTFERREAERREQANQEELENMRRALAASRGEEQQEESLTPDQIRQQERQRYEQQAAEEQSAQKFMSQTEVIAKAVAGTHGDAAVSQATQLLSERAGLDFSNKSHRELISDISELPNSGDVYYALAHDPDAASDILDASPRRQYALLTQFAAKVGPESSGSAGRNARSASSFESPASRLGSIRCGTCGKEIDLRPKCFRC